MILLSWFILILMMDTKDMIYGNKASTQKKKAEQKAALKAIRHVRTMYDFVVRVVNYKELWGLEYDNQKLTEMYKKG